MAWARPGNFRPSFFDVYVEGSFFNAGRFEGPDFIARLELERSADGLLQVARVIKANPTSSIRQKAKTVGAIRASLLGPGDRAYFIVETPGGESDLVATSLEPDPLAAAPQAIAAGALLRGLASSGSRVLFLRPATGLGAPDGAVEVVLRDVAAGEERVLGTGDYYYPYLEDEGRVAVAARIDWDTGSMEFFVAAHDGPMPQFAALRPLFSSRGVGTFRLSRDGGTYAFLGPEGLRIGSIEQPGGSPRFLRGNANGSPLPPDVPRQAIDISDAIYLLAFLFLGGPAPPCMDAADANDDGQADISDAIRILSHLFGGGGVDVTIPPPWPEPGVDPTGDTLDCATPQ